MATVFFTGFPGFLGSELLPRVLERDTGVEAVCLVQAKFAELARRRAGEITAQRPGLAGRVRIVEGDITQPGLGLSDAALARETAEVYHLAAVYDLSVARDLAMRVNVQGTRHVLEFAAGCPGLRRLQYVSTCYVSGRYPGVFYEDDLEKGQRFNNHYEETKYLAEVEVRRRMREGMPASIYRPAIVVGDSRTGATQKYDGPYYVIQWLLRQPEVAVLPVVGNTQETVLNVVPRDFVVAAIAYLSAHAEAAGKTFQLADPEPLSIDAMLKALGRATGRRIVRVPLPHAVAKWAIDRVPGVYPLMRIPSSALDYFVHPTRYDTRHTREALQGSGLALPRFADYAEALTSFVRAHPEVEAKAMV